MGTKRKIVANCNCLLYQNRKICDCKLPEDYPYEESSVGIFRHVSDIEILYLQCTIKKVKNKGLMVHG